MTEDLASRAPFPGLRAFRAEETDLFFGREDCINEMVDRLSATRFLAVLGSSGTGKSSLVKTGLLDALELGLMSQAGSRWRMVDFRPSGAPLKSLARGLLNSDETGGGDSSESDVDLLRAYLARGPRAVLEWCRSGHLAKGTNLLLLVDQFEELFRYQDYAGREEAEAFVALLIESAQIREFPVYVSITMRSEYLGACSLIDGLADVINAGMYLTPRMTRDHCREAIVGPAAVCGVDIEAALVNRLLNDLANFAPWGDSDENEQLDRIMRRADQLPLLQYTLNRMWLRARALRPGKPQLTIGDYEAIGGLSGALNAHANQIFEELGKARWPVIECVFRTLTAGSTIADAVRRPTRFNDLVSACGGDEATVRVVVDAFRGPGVNFLVPELDPERPRLSPDAYVDISHESLIRQWKRLGEWLQKEAHAAQQWRRLIDRFGTGELVRGRELANMVAWRDDTKPNAAWAKRYGGDFPAVTAYLQKSHQAQWRKRFLIIGVAAVVFATVSVEAILATHYARIAGERLSENQTMLVRSEEDANRAKLANDALLSLFEKMSNNSDQRSKSGAAITIDESLDAIRRFVKDSPNDPELRRFLAINLNVYGDIRLQANDLESARKAYEESLEIGRELAERDPARFQWQEVLSGALGRVAQVNVKSNELAEARPQYEEAIDISRKLIARNETERIYQTIQAEKLFNSLSTQLGLFGDLLVRASELPAALKIFAEKVEVHRKLLANAPGDQSRLETLSSALDRLGDVSRQNSDLAAARSAFEEELEIDRKLNERAPTRTSRRNLVWSLNRVGEVLRRQEELQGARKIYEELVDLNRKLAAEYPADNVILNDHQLRLNQYAEVLTLLGDKTGAFTIYKERLEVARRNLALDPENIDRRATVSTALDKIGELLLDRGDLVAARAAFEEEIEIDRKLYADNPDRRETRRNLGFSLARIADIRRRQNELSSSRESYDELLDLHRKLVADFPNDGAILNTYQLQLNAFAELLLLIGDKAAALAAYRERVEVRRRELALEPESTARLENLSNSLDKIGELLTGADDLAAARRAFEEALAIDRKLYARDPDKRTARTNLAFSLNRVGDILRRASELAGSRHIYEELMEFDRKLVLDFPDDASILNSVQLRLGSFGTLLVQMGDRAAALAVYRERLEIRRRRLALEPENIERMESVSEGLDRIGDLLLQAGEISAAGQAFEEELQFDRRLYMRDPTKKSARENLAFSLIRMADILNRRGDVAGGTRNYQEAVAIDRRLSESYPDDQRVQTNYEFRADKLTDLLLSLDDIPSAKRALEDRFVALQRVIVIRRRAASDPGNRQARADLIDAMSKATRAALLSNHPQEVITLADELLKLDSGQLTVGINRAHALLLTGRIADAKSIYEEGRRTRHPNDPQLTWIEYVKEDFAMLRRLGLADANLEQVARELGI